MTAGRRALLWQLLVLLALVGLLALLVGNLSSNLAARGIEFGYDFLTLPAGFDISERLIEFNAEDSYLRAYVVGLLNTLKVAAMGIAVASILGLAVALGMLSPNPLLASLSRMYVEVLRNLPLLLQLFFWYLGLTYLLPETDAPLQLADGVFLSKSGLAFPWWVSDPVGGAEAVGAEAVGAWAGGAWELPELGPFGLAGGANLSPEFVALLVGLSLYTSAFIAEVVRAGIQSVPRGQTEAARALGLSEAQRMRYVVLPQALRVILPPLTNQFLNLTKNSSLAVAIGYPELVSVATTTLNQTGRAVEALSLLMLVYLSISLLTSATMRAFERRVRIQEGRAA